MAVRGRSDASPGWLDRARRALREQEGRTVVAAVSGGSDSVGLLRAADRLAGELRVRLIVAHLDHGARGEASEADARFVAELADRLKWPSVLGVWKATRAAHFEADARRARYSWLIELARANEATAVLVGHTRDDQAETILHRVLRGTGPRGLGGMHTSRTLAEGIRLIRPLLKVDRASVRRLVAIGQDGARTPP
ncbi:MAG: tRNA lysidine(34) synthetase TilS [Isosphaeraceae bacterium]